MVRGGQVRVCYDAEAKRKVHEARDRAAMVRLAASSSTASSRRGSYSSRAQHRAAAKQASADAMAYTLSRMHVGHAMSQAMGAVTLPQIQGLLQSTAGFGGFQTAPHALAMGHPGSMPLSTAPYGADPSRMPYGAVPGVSMPLPPPGGPSPFPWGP